MKKKIFAIVSVITIGILISLYFIKPNSRVDKAYFDEIKICGFSAEIPYIEIEIENQKTMAKIDLGSCTGMSLPREFLEKLNDKIFIRTEPHYGIRGKKYEYDIYKLPKIKIASNTLSPAIVQESNLDFEKDVRISGEKKEIASVIFGRIGWQLFYNINLFLDCEDSLLAFCDSLLTLKERGYPIENFIQTPLLLDRNALEFEVMTDTGMLRCLLDTGCTCNFLIKKPHDKSHLHMALNSDNMDQHSVINPENIDKLVFDPDDIHEIAVFKIGGKDFGKVVFQQIQMPYDVDAIIGMEFLYDKLLFIDFPNRKIYLASKSE